MRNSNFQTLAGFSLFFFMGCSKPGPAEIHFGHDQCDYCTMTIADEKFGTELVNSKGKVYKFDSIECLAAYTIARSEEKAPVSSLWVTDFQNPGKFVRVDSATIIVSEQQNSPMGVGLVGFSSASQATDFISEKGGRQLSWTGVCGLVAGNWKL